MDLIEVHKFFPRIIDFFISREECHQSTEVEAALNCKVTADNKEQEGA